MACFRQVGTQWEFELRALVLAALIEQDSSAVSGTDWKDGDAPIAVKRMVAGCECFCAQLRDRREPTISATMSAIGDVSFFDQRTRDERTQIYPRYHSS